MTRDRLSWVHRVLRWIWFTRLVAVGLIWWNYATAQTTGQAQALAQSESKNAIASVPRETQVAAKSIEEFGEKFVRSSSTRNENVDTEEYLLEGENAATWTQRLAYQRVSCARAVSAEDYVGLLSAHFEREIDGPHLRIVRQQKGASIFAVQYPKTAHSSAEVTLALVTVPDAAKPNEMHVVQFTINPERLPLGEMEDLMKRWQARFQAKANAMAQPH